jgi:hypothetical protein
MAFQQTLHPHQQNSVAFLPQLSQARYGERTSLAIAMLAPLSRV